MNDSLLKNYEEIYRLQTEKIDLLEKQAVRYKEALTNLDQLVDVQNRLITAQQQQVRQLTGNHLKVIK